MEKREEGVTDLIWVSLRIRSVSKDTENNRGLERVALGADNSVYGEDGDGRIYVAGDVFPKSQDPRKILELELRKSGKVEDAFVTIGAVIRKEFPHEIEGLRKIGGVSNRLFLNESMNQVWIPIE